MSCARCDALAREAADLRAEVEAWRANDADTIMDEAAADRLARWKVSLGPISHGEVILVLTLVDRVGRVCSADRLVKMLRTSPFARVEDPQPKLAQVYVCRVRAKFRRMAKAGQLPSRFAAIDAGILTHWGQGWSMADMDAAAIKLFVGEG